MIERALIVDDEPAMQRTLAREVLKAYEVVLAGSAQQAIELMDRIEGLRAVVTDLDMGSGDDGIRVLEHAKELAPETARILVTGAVSRQLADELIASWAAHFVFLKPWDRGTIVRAIQEAVAFEQGADGTKSGVQLRSARIVESTAMRCGGGATSFGGAGAGGGVHR